MDPATAMLVGRLIDIGLSITGALKNVGINYREIMDEQEAAEAEGREIDTQMFIDQAQSAIDDL